MSFKHLLVLISVVLGTLFSGCSDKSEYTIFSYTKQENTVYCLVSKNISHTKCLRVKFSNGMFNGNTNDIIHIWENRIMPSTYFTREGEKFTPHIQKDKLDTIELFSVRGTPQRSGEIEVAFKLNGQKMTNLIKVVSSNDI